MEKPDVDFIEGLPPAISIDQKSTSKNPCSTVGTITEVYNTLRLLYARIGQPHCPVCAGRSPARPPTRSSTRSSPSCPRAPLPAPGPGGAGPQGRVRGAAAQLGQGVRQGQGRRRGPRPVGADPAGQDLQARHRDRGRPAGRPRPRGRREGPPPPGRLGRDGRRPVRGPGRGRAGRRGPRAAVLDPPGLPVRQPVVRGAGPAQLLLQRPLRGLPDCTGLGVKQEVDPELVVPQPQPARDRRGHPALAGHPRVQRVLRPAADRGGRGGRVRPRHPLGEADRRAAAGRPLRRRRAGPRPLQEPLRPHPRLPHHLRGGRPLPEPPLRRGRVRTACASGRVLYARGALPDLQGHPPAAREPGRHRRRPQHRPGAMSVGTYAFFSDLQLSDRDAFIAARVLKDHGLARVPARRRSGLPEHRPGLGHPGRRRPSGSGWPPRSAPGSPGSCTCSTSPRSGCTYATTTG